MTGQLLSVGIDLGTSTTQLVISRLTLENGAGAFAVPKVDITKREVIYRSAVYFTPLLSDTRLDAKAIRAIVEEEYRKANVTPEQFQTGAVIITGETARKENAREVLRALTGLAGDFVVATAGPDLESVLAARGAGADRLSATRDAVVLHYDIGGGTSNLALFQSGELVDTGCLDVGGRLVKLDLVSHEITYVSRKLARLFPELRVGEKASKTLLQPAVEAMTDALAEAGGLKKASRWLEEFITHKTVRTTPKPTLFTLSGGVADCVWEKEEMADLFRFGDIGPILGNKIREKFAKLGGGLEAGKETIRATVVGAGSYATEVSGSTIFYKNITFPLKNLPVLRLNCDFTPETIENGLKWFEKGEKVAISFEGVENPNYFAVKRMAEVIREGAERAGTGCTIVVSEADMGKALGQALARLGAEQVLCIDGIHAGRGSYLDVLAPAFGGTVVPVVVKTLAFEPEKERGA